MLGFSSMPSSMTRCSASALKTACRTEPVTCSQRSMVCAPSISTSGSTIGTSPCSWHRAAYRASAWALALMQAALGSPSPMRITARHFAKRAPRLAVFGEPIAQPVEPLRHGFPGTSRQRPGAGIDLDARHDPLLRKNFGQRHPGRAFLADRLVLHDDAADELRGAGEREQHLAVDRGGCCSVDGIPSASKRRVSVGTVSSAARIPFPLATRLAASSWSCSAMRYLPFLRLLVETTEFRSASTVIEINSVWREWYTPR